MQESKYPYNDNQASQLFNWCSGQTTLKINENVTCQVFNANEILTNEKSWKFYSFNRPIDHERVEKIIQQQEIKFKETGRFDFYFNPIVVCRHLEKLYLIDGQHRVATLKRMHTKYKSYFQDIHCIVLFIQCKTEQDIAYNFERVNSGTPLPPSYYNQKISTILDQYCAWMNKKYSSVISQSTVPRRPNFNLDLLKKEMSLDEKFKIATMEGKISTDILINATNFEMDLAKENYQEYESKNLSETMCKKIQTSKFYLGKNKMNEWIPKIINRARKMTSDNL